MAFSNSNSHEISLSTASEWTKNFRDANPGSGAIIAHAYGKSALTALLAQTNCEGLRVYYAIDNDGNPQLILVGVDASGNDLYEGNLVEMSYICPPDCSSANPLNSDE